MKYCTCGSEKFYCIDCMKEMIDNRCEAIEELYKNMIPGLDRLEDRLRDGCYIEVGSDSLVYLYNEDAEWLMSGETLRKLLVSVIMMDC